MIAALLVAFREGLEAALIVGVVFGYLKKTGQGAHYRSAWMGVLTAVAVSIVLAAGIQVIGAELEGRAEQIFEGITMFLAVGVLTWMVFWMRYQSRTLKSALERDVQDAIQSGQNRGLMAVTFLAVFREGVETALFLSAAAFATNQIDTLLGAFAGLSLAVLLGYLIFASSIRLNLRLFFNVTSVLLLVFAAGLLAHGIHEFQEGGLFITLNEHLWDTNHILDEQSTLGELLRAVIGYNGTPSLLEVIGYWAYWIFALFGVRWLVDRKVTRTMQPTSA
jgi:high-affinity iron transporter